MTKELVIKRLKLLSENKGVQTLSYDEAKVLIAEIDRLNKENEELNKFLRAFSNFIDDEEYWNSLGANGEDIECKVSHKWNELLYKIVHKGSE